MFKVGDRILRCAPRAGDSHPRAHVAMGIRVGLGLGSKG